MCFGIQGLMRQPPEYKQTIKTPIYHAGNMFKKAKTNKQTNKNKQKTNKQNKKQKTKQNKTKQNIKQNKTK